MNVKCTIFGKPAEYMDVKKLENGEWKNGKLLLSGFWYDIYDLLNFKILFFYLKII